MRERAERHAGRAGGGDLRRADLDPRGPDLTGRVEALIRQNLAAETAFDVVMLEWREHFARRRTSMMRERVGDLTDVHIRVLSLLLDLPDHDPVDLPKGANAILVTHDLTPSLTVQLDREASPAIATDAGTRTSHVAILARSLGLPAVVGLRTRRGACASGETVILDGTPGVLVSPDARRDRRGARERAERKSRGRSELRGSRDPSRSRPTACASTLRANVDLPDEAALRRRERRRGRGPDAHRVPRRRPRDDAGRGRAVPGLQERHRSASPAQPVVIRTFDIGGDKLPVGGYPHEPNPFLGWRAIRMCLDEPEIFRTQLRALLRAAVHGDVRIMLPLVVTVDEVREARSCSSERRGARGARRRAPRRRAARRHDRDAGGRGRRDTFANEVAFFSIGTNDLVQYTLAVDRGNARLAARFTPLHPAVLRLIHRARSRSAARTDLDVSVCGEMASQPLMAFALIGLGLRTLSVAPRSVARVKRLVRGHLRQRRRGGGEGGARRRNR